MTGKPGLGAWCLSMWAFPQDYVALMTWQRLCPEGVSQEMTKADGAAGGDPTGLRARSLGSLGRSYGLATTPQKDVLINNCFEFVTKEK